MLASVTVPVQKYQEAETQRIEALAKARSVQFIGRRYSDELNRMERIQKDAIARGLTGRELEDAKKQFLALDVDAEKAGRETEAAIVELGRQAELAVHLERMRNIWLALSALGVVFGGWLMFIGFKQWLRVPKHER